MRLVLSLLLLVAVSWMMLDVANSSEVGRFKQQYYGGRAYRMVARDCTSLAVVGSRPTGIGLLSRLLVESPPGSGQYVALTADTAALARAIPAGDLLVISESGTTVTIAAPAATPPVAIGVIVTNVTTSTITTTLTATADPGGGQFQYGRQDCPIICPSIYRDNCYENVRLICPSAEGAAAVVQPVGTECRETWTCPLGTQPYYYAPGSNNVRQPYTGSPPYAVCFAPPNNQWYLPDGTTQIAAVSCESPQ
ncbi:hypothetical protein GCK32_012365 [Trichostrongylus colubriformis]|uniref:Uncharacterized protein n=1 Tax=Trichostrongylus colubriformis TaxID=6319 RepID=A0AAN8F620_TRICO